MRSRFTSGLAVGVTAAVILTGCSGSSGSGSNPGGGSSSGGNPAGPSSAVHYANGGTFTMALPSDPGNLDPSLTPSSVARSMLPLAYDTLVNQKANGEFVSGLATKWNATATSAKFTLHKAISCSDGSSLTAKDVADNINYIADPKNQSPLLNVVVHQGTVAKANNSAGTVTVTSAKPNGFLLAELSGVFIICRAGLDNHKSLEHKTIGTGPWELSQAVPGDHYTFTPHKGYGWGPGGLKLSGPGVPDKVVVRVVKSMSTTANLMLSGQLNYAAVSGPDTARLDAKSLHTIDSIDTSGETWFNQAAGHPGADPAVRKALTVGVDMKALGKVATGGKDRASRGFITLPGDPCSGTNNVKGNLPEKQDVTNAKKILDDAGWKVGTGGVRAKGGKKLKLAFRYDAAGESARTAGVELLAKQWKALGVEVNTRALPQAQLNKLFFSTGAWDASWADFTFNLPSQMVAFVSGPTIPNGSNFSDIKNAQYTKDTTEATSKVGKAGCPLWNQAEVALLKDFNLVPMFDSVSHAYVNKAKVEAMGSGEFWPAAIRLLAD
jgi:peptide/nickel transport system substrate-binding protein